MFCMYKQVHSEVSALLWKEEGSHALSNMIFRAVTGVSTSSSVLQRPRSNSQTWGNSMSAGA